jgi:hypothetical protein
MYVGTYAKGDHEFESTTGLGRGECVEVDVECGGRRCSQNVATRYTDANIDYLHGNNSADSHLKRLIEKVAQARSWAVWMGVYSTGWMEMLIAGGGMSYHSARKLTAHLE